MPYVTGRSGRHRAAPKGYAHDEAHAEPCLFCASHSGWSGLQWKIATAISCHLRPRAGKFAEIAHYSSDLESVCT